MGEKLVIILFWLALMAYAAAFVFYVYLFLNKRRWTSISATSLMTAGWLLQTASLIGRWQSLGRIEFSGAFESYMMIAWALALVYLILELITRLKVVGAWVLPFICVLMGFSWLRYESAERLSPVVQSSWVIMHVSVIFLSYAGFTMAAALAVLYLVQQHQLKRHRTNVLLRRLPSLEVLDDLSNKAVSLSLPFITLVIVTGIIRSIKQLPDWYLDPIIIWTSITWLIYASYLGLRYLANWQGRRVAYLAIMGFASLFFIEIVRAFSLFHRAG